MKNEDIMEMPVRQGEDDVMETPACGDCGEDVRTDDGPVCGLVNRSITKDDFDEKATHPRWCPLAKIGTVE